MARGAGFELLVKPVPLRVRVYSFLVSNGPACLREIYEALGEKPSRVDDCLRRLWKKGLILRTCEPVFVFETKCRGRGGVVGYSMAINYYAVNNGRELPPNFVRYEDRKKDGRSRGIESKASKILNFLKDNRDRLFTAAILPKG